MERKTGWQTFILIMILIIVIGAAVDLLLTGRYQGYPQILPEIRRINLIISATLLTITSLVFYIFQRRISVPMQQLVASIREIVDGEDDSIELIGESNMIGPVIYGIEYLYRSQQIQIHDLDSERESLRSVLDQITDGIVIIDDNGSVTSLNPAAEVIFQIASIEAEGHSVAEVLRQHQWIDLYRTSLEENRKVSTTLEIPSQKVFLQGIAIPLGETMPGYYLMVFQDLFQIKRLETTRQDFISNISHELRTPLASLKALTDTLQEGALEDPAAAKRFLGRIDTEVDALIQIVSELLELSRIESGMVPLDLKTVSAEALLTRSRDRMRVQAERGKLAIEINCQAGLPDIQADTDRIGQVLVNLLHNAIKFSDPGEKIILNAYQNGGSIAFTVQDFGTGIPEADLDRIFERFYKTDQARSSGGTGLGLSIAKHIVEAHGGSIKAESSLGEGSSFTFSIPLITKIS